MRETFRLSILTMQQIFQPESVECCRFLLCYLNDYMHLKCFGPKSDCEQLSLENKYKLEQICVSVMSDSIVSECFGELKSDFPNGCVCLQETVFLIPYL